MSIVTGCLQWSVIKRLVQINARISAIIASVAADLRPCFSAFRLPRGGPGLVPPCILHRRLPVTAGDWHSVPERELHDLLGTAPR